MKKTLFLCGAILIAMTTWTLGQDNPANTWADAKWVWDEADANTVPQNNEPRYLRRTFELTAKPLAAELWITVDNIYTVYVNGQKVGADSEWATVEKYDVAKHLVVGKNVLAIKATNAGGVAGAIARLHIKTADKKDLFVVTDEKTKITQKAGKDWLRSDLDDSAWFAAVVLGDATIGPWNIANTPVANAPGSPNSYGFNEVDKKITKQQSAKDQLKHFIVPKDFVIELVAADPVVINPITMVLDDKGRIIVSESHTYRYGPSGSPVKPFSNPVIRLDPDGKGGFTRTLIADGFTDPVMGIAIKGNKLWLTACDKLYTYDIPVDPPAKDARKAGEIDNYQLTIDNFQLKDTHVIPTRSASEAWQDPSLALRVGMPICNCQLSIVNCQFPIEEKARPKPLAINKRILLHDKTKAWNPFGMFVLEWGPDGKLYMSVGDHKIDIHGPDGKISARGNSGMIMRMNPDGTKMERLTHGLRVPYSFEYDPFGQLWLLSNGEGNPDRFVRVIEGVDYHCYSRPGISNEWLAGRHPLAPPCEEVHGGAHTQLLRYYAANFPQEYQGNLFACNWGRHGFAGANRGIFRFILDDRNNVVKKETLVACTDPHFRPSHIHLDVDGSLLICDWYGRDDESDMTGRIWRLKYVGKNAPVVKHKLDSPEWKNDKYAIEALGSPDHLIREKAKDELVMRLKANPKAKLAKDLSANLAGERWGGIKCDPLKAANVIWVFAREGSDESLGSICWIRHEDWKVRRLSYNIFRRYAPKSNEGYAVENIPPRNADLAEVEKILAHATEKEKAGWLVASICSSIETARALGYDTNDRHLRYEVAWHLATCADAKTFVELLTYDDKNNSEVGNASVRLAGLLAIDIACYENFPTKKIALAALAKALENPGKLDHQLLLMVAQLDGDASIVPALEKLIARDDLPTATIAKAVLVLKAKSGGSLASLKLSAAAGKRLIEAVEKGQLKIASPADQLVIFEFLESEGPTPFALKQIEGQLRSNNKELKQAAHTLARRFGTKADALAGGLWPNVLNPKTKFEDTMEYLSTIARVEKTSKKDQWEKLLNHDDPLIRMETVRWWRRFAKEPEFIGLFIERSVDLQKKDANLDDDIFMVAHHLSGKTTDKPRPKDWYAEGALKELADMPAGDRPKRAAMGLQVFERNACTKCHTTATQTTLLAPSLKGVATQKVEYLIESVLYPSKIIKTGWEVEAVELKSGKTLTGLVKDEGKYLRILNLDKDDKVLKSDVESRTQTKVSIMPDGQEATLSRREFVDLIAYLQTLK